MSTVPSPQNQFGSSQSSTHPSQEMMESPNSLPPYKPVVPKTLEDTKLNNILIEDLIYKVLLSRGVMTGRDVANELCLPFALIAPILTDLKNRMFVGHKNAASMGDYEYVLADPGREKALVAIEYSAYVGSAPVLYEDYLESVARQSIRREQPDEETVTKAFSDLVLSPELFEIIGPAVNSGRGLFLYGEPGNGKTSIAERISRCFQNDIYIPRTLLIDGQLIKLYDPQCHEEVEGDPNNILPQHDARWVRIKRPVVVVGGELTMESLEIKFNELLRVSEAPLQLKANCGVFLIDDFGRQRVHHEELLNRWIVPLEKRIDYLTLPNGKKIEVPFDELILFSTNLDPKDLVDDAFLRRIPYKIHVCDPDEATFKSLMAFMAPRYGITFDESKFEYLVAKHYRGKRPFRACQARDILEQVYNACNYRRCSPEMTEEFLDAACHNYFAAMGHDD